ncbi:hypothetical protein [Sphingobium sp.]|uniref:hypothetical protein n=1 Tax=Sphingobium sp. TaxID=1912891 RepID=UPI002B739D27|nr:hypothetical protein [Sphingobium sp.]HUD95613.1 hypothetical protein [Sphingobium sp.]
MTRRMQHMGPKKRKKRAGISRAAILAAVWTLIAVTLLSALAPLGPPLSRAKGSAFNPATTEVVLKARARAMTHAVQPVRPDGDGLPPVALPCLAVGLVIGLWRMWPVTPALVGLDRLARLNLARAHRARAPPSPF